MYRIKKSFMIINILLFTFILVAVVGFIIPTSAQAQGGVLTPYWAAIPPYNIMWPLWSPGLSPLDPITGYTTPLVTSLTRDTVLPVQPGLVWDPYQSVPYLLYNTPPTFGSGLLYYHEAYGLNPWPPSYMLDPISGTPSPITLPLGWSLSAPIASGEFEYYVPMANIYYALNYGLSGPEFLNLLQPYDIWGPVLRTGVPTTPIILPLL